MYPIDAEAVRAGGLKTNDILQLGLSVLRYATRTDLLRGWRDLSGQHRLPERNAVGARLLEKEQPIVKVSTGIGG